MNSETPTQAVGPNQMSETLEEQVKEEQVKEEQVKEEQVKEEQVKEERKELPPPPLVGEVVGYDLEIFRNRCFEELQTTINKRQISKKVGNLCIDLINQWSGQALQAGQRLINFRE